MGVMPQEAKAVSDEVSIQQGFSDELRPSAAELYDAAFGAKSLNSYAQLHFTNCSPLGYPACRPRSCTVSTNQVAYQLLMDGIGVSPRMRGNGIGTKLVHSLIDYARKEEYRSVRLDVIDTNPAARRLYERVNFVPVKTEHFAYVKRLLGFGPATLVEYSMNAEA